MLSIRYARSRSTYNLSRVVFHRVLTICSFPLLNYICNLLKILLIKVKLESNIEFFVLILKRLFRPIQILFVQVNSRILFYFCGIFVIRILWSTVSYFIILVKNGDTAHRWRAFEILSYLLDFIDDGVFLLAFGIWEQRWLVGIWILLWVYPMADVLSELAKLLLKEVQEYHLLFYWNCGFHLFHFFYLKIEKANHFLFFFVQLFLYKF